MLASGSLAAQFTHAAQLIARIRTGTSLADGLLREVPEAERPAVQELVYTYLRAYALPDHLLSKLLQKPLRDMWLQALLGLALYRLIDRPQEAHTTVNQAVVAAGAHEDGRFKGLCNGVLRNFQRQQAPLCQAAQAEDVVRWAHPFWWIKHVQRDHRRDWQNILRMGNTRPPMALRVNLRQNSLADWLAQAEQAGLHGLSTHGEAGVLLESPVGVGSLPGFADGKVSVQDLGAQTAAQLLNPSAGMRVLDACAAPGGKTAHLLERADITLTALDVSPERCRRIEDNLQRLSLQATVKVADCRALDAWWDGQAFDAVLADVPCTASGVVRRHPDSKWLRQEADIQRFARTQREILQTLSKTVAIGGQLLYATCSVFRAENQDQVAQFLESQPNFSLQEERVLLPDMQHDGFYYARLQRTA